MSRRTLTTGTAEDILGQFYYALGQGAGTMRVQREAMAALRARYSGPIAATLEQWPSLAPNVLSFVTQVGRLAALQATHHGRTAISAADFTYARQLVESQVHRSGELAHGLFAGPLCPAVPGEQPPQPSSKDEAMGPEVVTSTLISPDRLAARLTH